MAKSKGTTGAASVIKSNVSKSTVKSSNTLKSKKTKGSIKTAGRLGGTGTFER